MGQATRTTKLQLDLGKRTAGGANSEKRTYLDMTAQVLDAGRAFYLEFFLAHAGKLDEQVCYYSDKHQEMRERKISANELLSWAEAATCATKEHPHPWAGWNFSERFPQMPVEYRRSLIKAAIGKARSYLSNFSNWQKTGKKRGKPGLPGARDHPTLYGGTLTLDLSGSCTQDRFVRLKVYTGQTWQWHNYAAGWQYIAAPEPQTGQSAARQDQSVRQRQSLRAGSRDRRGQSAWDIPLLLSLRREGREVLIPRRRMDQSQGGKSVSLSCLSL
jgi:hypothetical protein